MYWFGSVRPGTVPSDLTLDVALRRVTKRGVADGEFRLVPTGIGQLPALHVGQRWQDGRLIGKSAPHQFEGIVTLDPDHWRVVDAGEKVASSVDGELNYLIPAFEYKLPPRAMPSRCVAVAVDGVKDILIIPCIEVARAWYFRSTDLVLRLTSGPYPEARRQLYNDAYPAFAADGVPQVVLRTGLSESDAHTVSMLMHHLSAQRGATRIMDSVASASAAGRDAFIEALPPAVGARRLKARGRRFRSQGEERFLVTQLEEIPYPDVAARLAWDLDNTNQSEGDSTDATRAAWLKKRFPVDATSRYELRHAREPQVESASVHEGGHLPRFSGLPELERLPPRKKSTQSETIRSIADPPHGKELSTGAGESGSDGPGQLQVQDVHDPSSSGDIREVFPAGFESMLELVTELNARDGLACRVVPGSNRTSGPLDAPRSHFLNYNAKERGQWQWVDGRPRQFLVAEISTTDGIVYAIEIERRGPGIRGRLKSEAFALGVLAASQGRCFTLDDFEVVMKVCIDEQGIWRRTIGEEIRVARVRHAYASREAFAVAVVAAARGLLVQDNESNSDCEVQSNRVPSLRITA